MKKQDKEQALNLVRANVNKGITKKEEKKVGVIQSMINLLIETPQTKSSLISQLSKMFPDREESSIAATVKAQLSGKNGTRLERERGLELVKKNIKTVEGKLEGLQIKGFKNWNKEEDNEEGTE